MTVLRYFESNPVRAGMVAKAQDWRFGSAACLGKEGSGVQAEGATKHPLKLPSKPSRSVARIADEAPAQPLSHWLVRGPTPRPQPWLRFVNREEEAEQLAKLREAVNRGSPFGETEW